MSKRVEITEVYEVDKFHIFYSEGHIDKEVFLENVIEYIKSITVTDKDRLKFANLPTLEQVEYVYYKEVIEEVNFYSDFDTTSFIFSDKAKEGYSRMTRVCL